MKERPILFSAPMVRAILAGTKSQTRRIAKLNSAGRVERGGRNWHVGDPDAAFACPYGQPGGRLWVREAWAYGVHALNSDCDEDGPAVYAADGTTQGRLCSRWRPSIHMPRWASRITLEITGVRVERVQDISPSDAIAEGLKGLSKDGGQITKYGIPDSDGLPGTNDAGWPWHAWRISPVDAYRRLWEQINGAGSWDANPWVWVVEFRRIP